MLAGCTTECLRGGEKSCPSPPASGKGQRELNDESTSLLPQQQSPRFTDRACHSLAGWVLDINPNPERAPVGFAEVVAARGGCRMITAAELAERLGGKRVGASYKAFCPAHNDQHDPNLDIKDGDRCVLVHCFAGCSQEAVLTAIVAKLGVEPRDLFADNGRDPIVAVYNYVDESGKLLFQVCRTASKKF